MEAIGAILFIVVLAGAGYVMYKKGMGPFKSGE